VNGYFTVAEYPILEAVGDGSHSSVTDIDILAFRFPGAGRPVDGTGRRTVDAERHEPDPLLDQEGGLSDMLVGEVKEGRARLNAAARDPAVLRAALVRFGCCMPAEAPGIVSELRARGRTTTDSGHQIRMVAFGSTRDEDDNAAFTFVPMDHIVRFLQAHITEHWGLVRHVQTKEPVLGFLLMLEKARRGAPHPSSISSDAGAEES
jgi:hypothetical protein